MNMDLKTRTDEDLRVQLRQMIKPPIGVYQNVIIATIFINIFTFILPLVSMSVYQTVLPASASATLIALTIGVTIIILFDWLFNHYRSQRILAAQTDIDIHIAKQIYERVAFMKLDGRVMNGSALLTTVRDFDQVRSSLASGMIGILVDLPFLALFVIFLVVVSPLIGVVSLAGCAVILASGYFNSKESERLHGVLGKIAGERHSILLSTVRDFVQIRSSGWIDHMVEKHAPVAENIALANAHMNRSGQNAAGITKTLVQAVQTLTTLTGAWAVINGQIGMAALIGLSMLAARTAGIAGQIAAVFPRWVMAQKSLKAVEEALNLPQEKMPGQTYITDIPKTSDLSFEGVQFTYPEMPVPAIAEISMTIPQGKTVLVMGASGSGKTTLLKLAMGLLPPTQGYVRYGQVDLSYIDPESYRRIYSSVLAEPVLYGETLAEWFSAGMGEHALDQAKTILVDLGFGAVIKQHPAGIHRPLDNGGQGFSIGQKKAVALTRALIQKRGLLVLDEPTEGMDKETRLRIIQAIREQTKERTVLIASHDELALQLADYIAIMGSGRLLAFDTAQKVMAAISAGAQSK
ncbi:MAG: hypothetical protein DI626_05655 [Micavibrio aeruginosavorus]|uniref:Type I secretion system ATPase family protein n=1 Tax=Micavibrio aeruginosavorus TaxID=349221 RepID=A0A2W5A077_9BACT|nr:MAG: hypothetical protein DI626_05655 [Micavibrio aeruginosavorus]